MQSAILSRSCRLVHRLILPTYLYITRSHSISFCRLLYRQRLSIRLCQRYSESQPIRSRIWLCFLSCQFQVKLTGTLGWLSGAWRTLALGFQCVDFCVNNMAYRTLFHVMNLLLHFLYDMFYILCRHPVVVFTNIKVNDRIKNPPQGHSFSFLYIQELVMH